MTDKTISEEVPKLFQDIMKPSVSGNPKPTKLKNYIATPNVGDILNSENDNILHPFVYLGEHTNGELLATIITHQGELGNIPLKPLHMKDLDENGNEYRVKYDNSCFASRCLIKKLEWGQFYKEGELTKDGIDFVTIQLKDMPPEYYYDIPSWIERLRRKRKHKTLIFLSFLLDPVYKSRLKPLEIFAVVPRLKSRGYCIF